MKNLTQNDGLWERNARAKEQLKFLLKHANLSEHAKIIDLGSGLSPFLYHCRQRGFKNLYALEPSVEICRFLEGQGITTYPMLFETFITQKGLPRFDVMVLSHVLEHLINPDTVLGGLKDMLSDQGVLLIIVPYQDHLRTYTDETHLHFFNENSLEHLLTGGGYQIKFIEKDRLNNIEKSLVNVFKFFKLIKNAKRTVVSKPLLSDRDFHYLHRFFWRPLKQVLGLRIQVALRSSFPKLTALAKR